MMHVNATIRQKQLLRVMCIVMLVLAAQFALCAAANESHPRAYSFLASIAATSTGEGDHMEKAFKRFLDHEPNNGAACYYHALSLSKRTSATLADQIQRQMFFVSLHSQLRIQFSN
jgi:hypothetical protein